MNIKLNNLLDFLENSLFGESLLMCSFESFMLLLKEKPDLIEIDSSYKPFIKTATKKYYIKHCQGNVYKDFRIGSNNILIENYEKTCLVLLKIEKE